MGLKMEDPKTAGWNFKKCKKTILKEVIVLKNDNNLTALGIDENVEAVLCYIGAWITGIIFLILEKENKFVRFHAMQSLVFFIGLFILGMVVRIIPILGPIISFLITPIGIIVWLLLMYKAYQGEKYKLPYVGNFAEEQIFGKNYNSSKTNDTQEDSRESIEDEKNKS